MKLESAAWQKKLETAYETKIDANKYIIVRVDGRAFSKYTKKNCDPKNAIDKQFNDDMTTTATLVAKEISGCVLAYTQSDEISYIMEPAPENGTHWCAGRTQKISSLIAAMTSTEFNRIRENDNGLAVFDARSFAATKNEVKRYLGIRKSSAHTNYISMLSHKHLDKKTTHKKKVSERKKMLTQKGIPLETGRHAIGSISYKIQVNETLTYTNKTTKKTHTALNVTRTRWKSEAYDTNTIKTLLDNNNLHTQQTNGEHYSKN